MTKLAKLAKSTLSLSSLPSLPCKFFFVPCVWIISGHPSFCISVAYLQQPRFCKSLVIIYIFLIYSLIINDTTMAKCTISNGIETITGALKKTTEQVPKLRENGVSKRKESELTGSFSNWFLLEMPLKSYKMNFFCIFLLIYLVMSKKSRTFARFFAICPASHVCM